MTIHELMASCEATADVMTDPQQAVTGCYTSDLLSDVMAHAPEGCALVTIQNHRNTVAVATLVGARVIVICHNRSIPEEMATAARDEGIALVRTPLDQYHVSCCIGALLGAGAAVSAGA